MSNNKLKIFIVVDTDVIKPYGKQLESLGKVKDGSALELTFEKGYKVTSIIGLSKEVKHPLPFYDKFHSETQKNFNSINEYTLNGLTSIVSLLNDFGSVFIFDCGYDDSKLIKYFKDKKQYLMVRLTKKT